MKFKVSPYEFKALSQVCLPKDSILAMLLNYLVSQGCLLQVLNLTEQLTHKICNIVTQDGDFALKEAARYGRSEVVSVLVKARASLDLQDDVRVYHSAMQ